MFSKSLVSATRLAFLPARQNAIARFGTSSANKVKYAPVPKNLKSKMQDFQIDNGLPVHIRGGHTDRILYIITALVCGYGLFDCVRVYYHLSYPENQRSKLIWGR